MSPSCSASGWCPGTGCICVASFGGLRGRTLKLQSSGANNQQSDSPWPARAGGRDRKDLSTRHSAHRTGLCSSSNCTRREVQRPRRFDFRGSNDVARWRLSRDEISGRNGSRRDARAPPLARAQNPLARTTSTSLHNGRVLRTRCFGISSARLRTQPCECPRLLSAPLNFSM